MRVTRMAQGSNPRSDGPFGCKWQLAVVQLVTTLDPMLFDVTSILRVDCLPSHIVGLSALCIKNGLTYKALG